MMKIKFLSYVIKYVKFFLIITILSILSFCDKNNSIDYHSSFKELEKTGYYKSEIFSKEYLKIYGKWKLSGSSGGFSGTGCDLFFDFLEIKEYGIYGFVKDNTLMEFGKIIIESSDENVGLKISFEEDEYSGSIFFDKVKYVLAGKDVLTLNSPCCDRCDFHFQRIK